tara:strand:- start:523 stop:2622 length:2100 start_codon:yes stop_codon:yes gene_type:complete
MKDFESQDASKSEVIKNTEYSKEQIINQALRLHSKGKILEAAKYYQYFLDQGFSDPIVLSNYGVIMKQTSNTDKAIELYEKSIDLFPNSPDAYANLGNILRDIGRLEDAELSTRKAIAINPNSASSHLNLGLILKDLGKLKEAETSQRKAIELNPNYAEAYSNLGNILKAIGNLKEAEFSQKKAIELNPNYANAYCNLGNILHDLGKLEEAELSFRKAIHIKSDFAEAYYNLALLFKQMNKYKDTINSCKQAININNKLSSAKAELIISKGMICDWSDQDLQKIWIKTLGVEGSAVAPFGLLPYTDDPLNELKRSNKYYKEKYFRPEIELTSSKKNKIHIGYFSADFRDHVVMHLICSLLELHNKSKFKIYLYSFVKNKDHYTDRARKSGCVFRDINKLSEIEAVKLARSDKIDIAVDLMGYTKYHRMSIFSYRVAPIQINYLGYPGSLGSDVMDYIIADKIVIPYGHEKFYKEKIIRMPNCYLCTDDKMKISKKSFSRKDFNLPEKGFIFTCFNGMKKITPNEFDIWMRLLKKIKGSVLWLKRSNKFSVENLCIEAEKRNVDKNRLIFTDDLPLDKHLARHSLGDLGLDTFTFNGCTTSLHALWAGMPVLTKMGETFSARFTASILHSIGVSELITYDENEYENVALRIASNEEELLNLKSKIVKKRNTSPLFNSQLFTNDLENVYEKLNNNYISKNI